MRTYANFLLFEGVLSTLPTGSSAILNAAASIVSPYVPIVEADCGTQLGTLSTVGYNIEGQTELATGSLITIPRISTLLTMGTPTIRTRNTSSCISKGGICAACCTATTRTIHTVGSIVKIPNEFIYKTDIIKGDQHNHSYPVYQASSSYIYTNLTPGHNFPVYPEVVSLSDSSITFSSVRTVNDVFALHYYTNSTDPFLEYLARSYSGGLFGLAPLTSYTMPIKPSVYQTLFSPQKVQAMRLELDNYSSIIPTDYLQYCDTIQDVLERVLFIIYLYAIYANVIR